MKVLKVPFLTGVILCLFYGFIALIMRDPGLLLKLNGWSGAITLGLAMIFSGAFVSGNRMRANTYSEDAADRKTRINLSGIMLHLSIPPLTVFVITYFTLQ